MMNEYGHALVSLSYYCLFRIRNHSWYVFTKPIFSESMGSLHFEGKSQAWNLCILICILSIYDRPIIRLLNTWRDIRTPLWMKTGQEVGGLGRGPRAQLSSLHDALAVRGRVVVRHRQYVHWRRAPLRLVPFWDPFKRAGERWKRCFSIGPATVSEWNPFCFELKRQTCMNGWCRNLRVTWC